MSVLQARPTPQLPKMSRTSKMDVPTAVRRAQESESEMLDAATESTLTAELDRIWSRIQAQPAAYTMNQIEFSVFNRYRAQPRFQNETARRAIERYWNSRRATNSC